METPTDNIVSPFHNFGSSTQYSGTLSRTPNQIIELEKPSTLSPLSRGKKWTEKLARFQRSSAKKKRFSPSPISSSTFSFSPKSRVTSSNSSCNEDGNLMNTPSPLIIYHNTLTEHRLCQDLIPISFTQVIVTYPEQMSLQGPKIYQIIYHPRSLHLAIQYKEPLLKNPF